MDYTSSDKLLFIFFSILIHIILFSGYLFLAAESKKDKILSDNNIVMQLVFSMHYGQITDNIGISPSTEPTQHTDPTPASAISNPEKREQPAVSPQNASKAINQERAANTSISSLKSAYQETPSPLSTGGTTSAPNTAGISSHSTGGGANEGEDAASGGGWRAVSIPKPKYPALSRQRHEEGQVLVSVEILSSGQAGLIQIKKSSGFARLDQAALQAASRITFHAAAKTPDCPVTVIVPYHFKLTDK